MSPYAEYYRDEVIPALIRRFNYENVMEVPKLKKICVNMGVGGAIQNAKLLDNSVAELSLIVGQRATITKAKKSIAGFKLRQGMPIGCRVTLRRSRMFDFLDKLFNVALARVRDFRGLSDKIFDGRANCTIGIKEHIIFPEIDYDKIDKVKGLNISIVTTAKTDAEGLFLLKQLGMPVRN